ncbi:MAG: hypothetical protein IKU29_10445 [Parabacteroides sp.]|nr:hypothetical protein [Parabacteroides sp.]
MKIYTEQENTLQPIINEPIASYHKAAYSSAEISFISDEELQRNCMTLEESKRRIMERIHKDFPNFK